LGVVFGHFNFGSRAYIFTIIDEPVQSITNSSLGQGRYPALRPPARDRDLSARVEHFVNADYMLRRVQFNDPDIEQKWQIEQPMHWMGGDVQHI
jgi:hypothetical protein